MFHADGQQLYLVRCRIDLVENPKAITGTTAKLPGCPKWGRLVQRLPIPGFLSRRMRQLLLDRSPQQPVVLGLDQVQVLDRLRRKRQREFFAIDQDSSPSG